MKAIVIATTPTSKSLPNLMKSLSGQSKYKTIVLSDYSWEVGKIKFIYDHTDIEEFVLLHDSCEVKDLSLFDVFDSPHSVSFSSSPQLFGSYLGKYQRAVLDRLEIPIATSKLDSVDYEESFNQLYVSKAGIVESLQPPLVNSDIFVSKFGRECMILENQYLIKYKATWSRNQLK